MPVFVSCTHTQKKTAKKINKLHVLWLFHLCNFLDTATKNTNFSIFFPDRVETTNTNPVALLD